MRLPGEPRAVAEARRAVESLSGELSTECLDDLRLLVTELVTNAVRHAGGWVDLRVVMMPSRVRVEVFDSGPGFEAGDAAEPGTEQLGGRGLYLVQQISDRWGVEQNHGNLVWFELAG